jgi:hypothetical protein
MVKGLSKFKEFFKNYSNNYLLIGGTACERHPGHPLLLFPK